jgi:hypothetical protein
MNPLIVRYWKPAAIAGALVAVAIWFAYCRPKPNVIPAREQFSIDSGKVTKPAFDSTQHAAIQSATTVITKIVHDSGAVVAARAEADQLRHVADSALAVARQLHDTSSAAFVAAENATKEADRLRASNELLAADLHVAKDTIVALVQQIRRDSTRQHATDDLNARLARDVKTAGQCRILPFVACPSRLVVAAAAVLVDEGIHHRKQLGLP